MSVIGIWFAKNATVLLAGFLGALLAAVVAWIIARRNRESQEVQEKRRQAAEVIETAYKAINSFDRLLEVFSESADNGSETVPADDERVLKAQEKIAEYDAVVEKYYDWLPKSSGVFAKYLSLRASSSVHELVRLPLTEATLSKFIGERKYLHEMYTKVRKRLHRSLPA